MNKKLLSRPLGRCIGLDVHLDFIVIAICESGQVYSAGRVPSTPEGIGTLLESLLPTDRVALEVTGSSRAIARQLEPHVAKVIVVTPVSHCPPRDGYWSNSPAASPDTLILSPSAPAAGDLDGVEFAALDLVQNGLAGAPEALGGLAQRHVSVGHVRHESGADLIGEAEAPGGVWVGLLAAEQAGVEPPVDGGVRDAELLGSLGDRV